MNVIDPRGMTVMEWTDRMIPLLIEYGNIGKLDKPSNWQEWARSVILINQQWQNSVPNPYQFKDWLEWAERFLQVIT
jgi:hypothetical protein